MNFLRVYLKIERTKMDDLKKQLLEIETSGDANSMKIIKLVAAFKALLIKSNENEVILLKCEL